MCQAVLGHAASARDQTARENSVACKDRDRVARVLGHAGAEHFRVEGGDVVEVVDDRDRRPFDTGLAHERRNVKRRDVFKEENDALWAHEQEADEVGVGERLRLPFLEAVDHIRHTHVPALHVFVLFCDFGVQPERGAQERVREKRVDEGARGLGGVGADLAVNELGLRLVHVEGVALQHHGERVAAAAHVGLRQRVEGVRGVDVAVLLEEDRLLGDREERRDHRGGVRDRDRAREGHRAIRACGRRGQSDTERLLGPVGDGVARRHGVAAKRDADVARPRVVGVVPRVVDGALRRAVDGAEELHA